jgi:hypothetical protein
MRTLPSRPQPYRLLYFGAARGSAVSILREVELVALDASGAITASASMPWPAGAIGLRIVDQDGHEVFERLKADWL